jgi:hypothetical protein
MFRTPCACITRRCGPPRVAIAIIASSDSPSVLRLTLCSHTDGGRDGTRFLKKRSEQVSLSAHCLVRSRRAIGEGEGTGFGR